MPNLMVVGAHHDDCEWQAGGLALLLQDIGWQVRFLVVTNSSIGLDKKVDEEAMLQREKALKSANILGIEKIILDFPSFDDSLSTSKVASRIGDEFAEFEPDILVCDWPRSSHPDHRLAGTAALRAWRFLDWSKTRLKKISEVLCYTAYPYGKVPEHFVVNIGEYWEQLCRALKSFPEFENPRGNNLILSKDKYHIEGNLY